MFNLKLASDLMYRYFMTFKPFCPEGPDDIATRGYIATMIETLVGGDERLMNLAIGAAIARLRGEF